MVGLTKTSLNPNTKFQNSEVSLICVQYFWKGSNIAIDVVGQNIEMCTFQKIVEDTSKKFLHLEIDLDVFKVTLNPYQSFSSRKTWILWHTFCTKWHLILSIDSVSIAPKVQLSRMPKSNNLSSNAISKNNSTFET